MKIAPLIGFSGRTLTGSTIKENLTDAETQLAAGTIGKPGLLKRVMEFSAELITRYAAELKRRGADYLIVLDPTSVIMSPVQFATVPAPFVEQVGAAAGSGCILHVCGDTAHLFREMGKLRYVIGLSLDSMVDLGEAREKSGKIVIGNVSPSTVCYGTEEEISAAVAGLMARMKGIDDFIFSTGCDLPPETPQRSIAHLMRCARTYR